jgi:DNA-binding CsgD family transcriptional regulator
MYQIIIISARHLPVVTLCDCERYILWFANAFHRDICDHSLYFLRISFCVHGDPSGMASYRSPVNPELVGYLNKAIDTLRLSPAAKPLAIVERLRSLVGFDHYAVVGLDIEGMHFGRGALLLTDMPEAYTSAYISEGLDSADPLVRLASPGQPVVPDQQKSLGKQGDAKAQRLGQIIRRFEIAPRTGFTLWNSRGAYGGAVFTRKTPFSEDEMALLSSFIPVLHREASRPALDALSRCIGLSRSELECIRLAAYGLTSDDIAEETPLTRETVNTYLKSATKKLKARNRTQAVVHALRIGMID